MKTKYEAPIINVLTVGVDDVIATSEKTSSLSSEKQWTPTGDAGGINWGDIWS